MISVDGLTVEFGGSTLFSDISFVVNDKDRIALMGKNGAGKSTLLKIMAGVKTAGKGRISAPKEAVIAYLPQHLLTEDSRTVFEETALAFSRIQEMEREIAALNEELAIRTDYESESYSNIIERVSSLSEMYYSIEEINFDGTLILVSHDRDFLDGLVSKVYEFGNKQVKEHLGAIYSFLQKKKLDNLRELERKKASN